jgi:hypothetical protein
LIDGIGADCILVAAKEFEIVESGPRVLVLEDEENDNSFGDDWEDVGADDMFRGPVHQRKTYSEVLGDNDN